MPEEMRQALQAEIQARFEAQSKAEQEKQRAEQEKQRADTAEQALDLERQKAAHLAQKLRELGIDPDEVG